MQPDTSQQPQPAAPVAPSALPPVSSPEEVPEYQPPARQTPAVSITIGDPNGGAPRARRATTVINPVQWQAKEYIAPDKSPIWYTILAILVAAVVALDVLVLKAYSVSAVAVVIGIAVVVMHVRPARLINYELDGEGLHVDNQFYALADYKAFGVLHDGKENVVHLIPVKRFKPSLQVYFPVEYGEGIVDLLAARLPMQELRLDFVDQIVKYIRL